MDIPQKALKGLVKETGKLFTGSNKPTWNPEDSIAEKREWSSRNSAFHSSFTQRNSNTNSGGTSRGAEDGRTEDGSVSGSHSQSVAPPLPIFDYFCVVGLEDLPETVEAVWGKGRRTEECTLYNSKVLHSFPPAALPEDLLREIPSYCFPIGTGAYAVRRSGSDEGGFAPTDLGEITDVVYGQHYDLRSDASFVFQLQTTTADRPAPEVLFGVCFYRKEFLHRRPKMFRPSDGIGEASGEGLENCIPERLVASARCYCLLSRVPMFERHFELLRNILSFERHHQIEEYANQVEEGLWTGTPASEGLRAVSKPSEDLSADEQVGGSSVPSIRHRKSVTIVGDFSSSESDSEDDTALAPVRDHASRFKPHHERKLTSLSDFHTPEDTPEDTPTAPLLAEDDDSDLTPFFTAGDRKDATSRHTKSVKTKRTMSRLEYSRQRKDRATSDDLDAVRKRLSMMQMLDSGDAVEGDLHFFSDARADKFEGLDCKGGGNDHGRPSETNNYSTELGSWIEADDSKRISLALEDTAASKHEAVDTLDGPTKQLTSPLNQAWYNRHPLKLLEHYMDNDYRTALADKAIAVSVTNLINARGEPVSSMKCNFMTDIDFLAAKELEQWAVCVLCRALSVENIVTYLTAVLLERQIVVFEANIAYLSAIVLSLQPLLAPFTWQSLLLPIVPIEKQDLLEAPVPFVIGMLTKTRDIRAKCGGLVRVNAYKDDVKNASFPRIPNVKALIRSLAEPHRKIRSLGMQYGSDMHPIYELSPEERREAASFTEKVRSHLLGLTSDLAFFYVTDVGQSDVGRGASSVLLREAFVESFDEDDRDFVDQWTQSQMFELYCDWVTCN